MPWPAGRKLTQEHKDSISKTKKGKYHGGGIPYATYDAIPKEVIEARRQHFIGSNNPRWKGGHKHWRGSNWRKQRDAARRRDAYTCQDCGRAEEELGRKLQVHHIVPFESFEAWEEANNLDNLISLCISCHVIREQEWLRQARSLGALETRPA